MTFSFESTIIYDYLVFCVKFFFLKPGLKSPAYLGEPARPLSAAALQWANEAYYGRECSNPG